MSAPRAKRARRQHEEAGENEAAELAASVAVAGPRLQVGAQAPQFSAVDQDGEEWDLARLMGRRTVLFFFPRANTPGCTAEARRFAELWQRLDQQGVRVLGVSRDLPATLARFRAKHALPFTLLSDPNGAVRGAYGAVKQGGAPLRSTVVLAEGGGVEAVWYGVRGAAEHPDAVWAFVQEDR